MDEEEFEKVGNELLLTATKLEPDNIIYKMVYLGSILDADQQFYRQAVIEAASKVKETFRGIGCLNRYFRQVLYRLDKKA
ncbi:hypothetical protein [Flectobacillus roseus]|uniref:hypothetical protein n=1 Tax=Flectobacillus roseus TaxID=502259 RepID=UPI0024B83D21|nr:hypothetical protein [Flectobacillus roseus]MDI9871902.1 hypothetical protein [Flectobacillus roseus]